MSEIIKGVIILMFFVLVGPTLHQLGISAAITGFIFCVFGYLLGAYDALKATRNYEGDPND